MKFLVDRCAGRRLADWLRSEGHDVVESRERGPDPGDRTLLEWAAGEGRVLVTIDTDFGALVFVEGLSHCGVVRLPDVVADTRIALMRQVLARHGQEVERGAQATQQAHARLKVRHALEAHPEGSVAATGRSVRAASYSPFMPPARTSERWLGLVPAHPP